MLLNDMHEDWNETDDDHREGIVLLHTSGEGLWSTFSGDVRVTELVLDAYESDIGEPDFGELRVHFNTNDWRVDQKGLIYTDPVFEAELLEFLTAQGYDSSDVGYSEQGMQGDNYVSFDAGANFIASWKAKNG
jgi:hypothetical protein